MSERQDEALRSIGAEVGREEDAWLEAGEAIRLARERLFERPRRRRGRWLVPGIAAALAAAAALLVWGWRQPSSPLAYDVDGAPSEGRVEAAEARRTVRFSDGSRLVVAPHAALGVLETRPAGSRVVLERGRVWARITHADQTDWRFMAGPFDVRVIGTVFQLSWDPDRGELSLRVQEGAVMVRGPRLGEGRRTAAGETLVVRLEPSAPSARASPSVEPAPPEPAEPPAPSVVPRRAAERPRPAEPDWRSLARARSYREALELVERAGFEAQCERLGSDDLLLLSSAARSAHRSDRAREALMALRRRFAGTSDAALAAYTLGRIAFDDHRDATGAAEWFSRYLQEEPRGALAREALGRLMEAQERAGRHGPARESAREYLAHYPSGPHAALARSLVQ